MKKKLKTIRFRAFVVFLYVSGLMSTIVFAEYIEGFIDVMTEFTDNALKRDHDKLSERQDKVSLGMKGNYKNNLIDFAADYVYSDYRFQYDSQPDRNTLEGVSTFYLGEQSKLVDLTVVHSRRGLIGDPGQLDLLRNYDEREILSVYPAINIAVTPVDTLSFSGNFSDVKYRRNPARDSRQKGIDISWQHRLSSIDALALSVSRANVSFSQQKGKDYTYYSSLLAYSAALRQLRYSISGGYNKTISEQQDDYSSPSYEANVAYGSDVAGVSLFANRSITDTSIGDGNRESSTSIGNGDVGNRAIDRIDRKMLELGSFSQVLCATCSLSFQLRWRRDNYLELPEDNTERGVTMGFDYRVSPLTNVSLRANRREQRFDNSRDNRAYHFDRQTIRIERQLNRDVSLNWFVEHERRYSRSRDFDYAELSSGISVHVAL